MKCAKLNIAEFGDIHLGHPNTPAEYICRNLYSALPDNDVTGELDIIFLAGDVFDRQLNFPDDGTLDPIRQFFLYLLKLCKKRDIALRVLEGTPSHDWKQSREFIRLNEYASIGADVAYVDTLSIEYIDRFGIYVLYVPDEWRVLCDDTWTEVVKLLERHNLDKVDLAIMHGCFPHQMPPVTHGQFEMHNPDRYLGIVKSLIFIGHIHQMSVRDRIVAAGSFDRLCHGDELDKGHMRATILENGEYTLEFVINHKAKLYKTIECTGLESEPLLAEVQRLIKPYPKGSDIRLKADRLDPAIGSIDVFKDLYPSYNWTTKVNKSEKSEKVVLDTEIRKHVVGLNRETLVDLLLHRISLKKPEQHELCGQLLNEVMR